MPKYLVKYCSGCFYESVLINRVKRLLSIMWMGFIQSVEGLNRTKRQTHSQVNSSADCLWTSSAPLALLGLKPSSSHNRFSLASLYNLMSQTLLTNLSPSTHPAYLMASSFTQLLRLNISKISLIPFSFIPNIQPFSKYHQLYLKYI